MNKLIIVLLLLCNSVRSQQSISLCGDITKEYSIITNVDNITVEINPETYFQEEDNIIYVTYKDIGTYVITATSYSGECYAEDKIIVNVIECDSTLIWVPNSFTPNADINNYEFGAYGINIKEFKMEIFNRWGELLFVSNDITNRWNGIATNNIPFPQDIYPYKILYRDNNNKFHEIFGRITLIH